MVIIQNNEIADCYKKVADLLEIEGANPFRVRAYRNAAQTITGLTHSIDELIAAESDLTQLNGHSRGSSTFTAAWPRKSA